MRWCIRLMLVIFVNDVVDVSVLLGVNAYHVVHHNTENNELSGTYWPLNFKILHTMSSKNKNRLTVIS